MIRFSSFFIFTAVLLLTGCLGAPADQPDEIVLCPADVQECNDGSFVARDSSANCAFYTCPITPLSMTDTSTISIKDLPTAEHAGDTLQTRAPAAGDTIAKIMTNHGDIWLRLFPEQTPKTVENFTGLAERGYYDGLIFHRVIPDFMIQGGDPTGTGTGGTSIWGTDFADEPNSDLSNIHGALSMANRGPATNGSQFFIVQAEATPWLDGKHTVFGQVFHGFSALDAIAAVPRGPADKPVKDILMTTINIFHVTD